jgi:hypothetical protein
MAMIIIMAVVVLVCLIITTGYNVSIRTALITLLLVFATFPAWVATWNFFTDHSLIISWPAAKYGFAQMWLSFVCVICAGSYAFEY